MRRIGSASALGLLGLLSSGLFGCGAIRPNLSYEGFGKANPSGDAALVATLREGSEPAPVGEEVLVLVDTLPEGVTIDKDTIQIEKGYDHALLGKFRLQAGPGSLVAAMRFPDYKDDWRKGYCYWQAPLGWVTLLTWTLFVPLAYPCWGDPKISKQDAVDEAKQIAKAAGGDVVILSYGNSVSAEGHVYNAQGYVLKLDPRMKGGQVKIKPIDGPTKEL
jgi:hypothetical protein